MTGVVRPEPERFTGSSSPMLRQLAIRVVLAEDNYLVREGMW